MYQKSHYVKKIQFLNKEKKNWVDAKNLELDRLEKRQKNIEFKAEPKKNSIVQYSLLTSGTFLFFLSIARGLYPARLHYSIYYNAVSATGNWVNNSIGFIFFILALTSLGILTYPIYKFLIMFTQEYSENLSRILIILAKISSLSLIMVGIFLDTTDPNYKWMAKVHGLFAITYFISTSSFFICLGIFQIENHDEMRKTHESHILNVLILFFLTVFFAGMIGMFFSFLNLDYHTHIQIYLCTFQHWSFWEWHFILAHVILMPLTSMKLKNLQDSTKIFS